MSYSDNEKQSVGGAHWFELQPGGKILRSMDSAKVQGVAVVVISGSVSVSKIFCS